MSLFDSNKVYVNYRDEYAYSNVIIPRRYTLTHSDESAELFLNVGTDYARDKIKTFRDDVLGEWIFDGTQYFFYAYVSVDGKDEQETAIKNAFFRQELPLALKTIRYGDSHIFNYYPALDSVQIIMHFQSKNPLYNKVEPYGTFELYTVNIKFPKMLNFIS